MSDTTTTTPYPQAGGKLPSEHDGFAIASLVTAFFVPILGIIFGHLSNHRAKLAHRAKSALAVTGLVLGYVFTGITALIIVIAVAVAGSTTPSVSANAAPPASSAPASPAAPAAPAGIYANANQIVQALKAHHVPVTNVVAGSGFWSGEGATSGVWATTAPGDSAAVFGGSENPVQDTEIVVFQNHAKAVAYANLGTDPNATPDPDHATILGTNWAVDAATPAAPKIRAALGGTLIPNVPASTAPAAPSFPASQPATSAPAAPAGPTVSQQQALESAKSYLDMGTGFSEKGLIDQLSSPSGEQFSVADATWAVAHSGADWNAQAVMSAKGYMKMGGFSRAGLIDQLTSPSGEQFTLAQATYAVNQVGL